MFEMKFKLEDVMGDGEIGVRLTVTDQGIVVHFDGYGDMPSEDGDPVLIEFCEGVPRVVVWNDINREDPTDVITLEGAAESKRV